MPTEEQIKKYYATLSPHARNIIDSAEIATKIRTVAKQHDLNDVEQELLLNEIGLVLLTIEKEADFVTNLSSVLEIDIEKARKINKEITSFVFSHTKEGAVSSTQHTPTTAFEKKMPLSQTVLSPKITQSESEKVSPAYKMREHVSTVHNQTEQDNVKQISGTKDTILKQVRQNKHTVNIKDFVRGLE